MRSGEFQCLVGQAGEFWSGMRPYLAAGLVLVLMTLCIVAVVVMTARAAAARRRAAGGRALPDDPAQQAIACTTARDALLAPGEMLFYRLLSPLVAPRCLVFAKVGLADLFEVGAGPGRLGAYRMLSGKRIDFILCDPATSSVVAGFEMDENTPASPDHAERRRFIDDLFASNGIPLLRVPVGASEDVARLREFLVSHELLAARAAEAGRPA
jgi:hypothetical protein